MSSPIAIPRATKTNAVRRESDDVYQHTQNHRAARSLPTNARGAYVPVHRRGASASSLPESHGLPAGRRGAHLRTRALTPENAKRDSE
ncbi:hypothetical protein BN946_scf184844.g84 [Trametes cinnabarina]|uniref:Uncharacterized protein n=1 Tax=Pycnoporus cinnabarinus TaxID=5643 RepID=A0A060S9Q4_PYCCI|nr:hypothetical protein BN946_scf184844.g84 [Trametes cinnabarina]